MSDLGHLVFVCRVSGLALAVALSACSLDVKREEPVRLAENAVVADGTDASSPPPVDGGSGPANGCTEDVSNTAPLAPANLVGTWIAVSGRYTPQLAEPGKESRIVFGADGQLEALFPAASPDARTGTYQAAYGRLVTSPATVLTPAVVNAPGPCFRMTSSGADAELVVTFPMYGETTFRRVAQAIAP